MKTIEMKKRLESLENTLFIINMVDRWTAEDYRRVNTIEAEIAELKEVLGI